MSYHPEGNVRTASLTVPDLTAFMLAHAFLCARLHNLRRHGFIICNAHVHYAWVCVFQDCTAIVGVIAVCLLAIPKT